MNRIVEEPPRQTPVTSEYDVVVAGGGVAGLVSALAAARNNARTAIVEQYGFLGGTATGGLMARINGFRNERPPNNLQTVRGIAQEIVLKLHQRKAVNVRHTGHYEQDLWDIDSGELPYCLAIDPEVLKMLALEMVEEAGVHLHLYTHALEAVVSESQIQGVIVQTNRGREAITADIVIDASGDGDIAQSAGVPFHQSPEEQRHLMPISQLFRLANVDMDAVVFEDTRPGFYMNNTYISLGGTVTADGADPQALTEAEVEARKKTWKIVDEMRKKPGFQNAMLIDTSTHLGVRETRRFVGDYTLTDDDALHDVRFEDSVAICSNPIPGFYDGTRHYLNHVGFDVPYRCLLPQGVETLYLVGRNISAEQRAFQSVRSMAPAMAIAQAVGTAAALCIEGGCRPREVDVDKLRRVLKAQGAIVDREEENNC